MCVWGHRDYERFEIWRAAKALQGLPIEARRQGDWRPQSVAKSSQALDALHTLAAELRKREPSLTKEVHKVYTDPENVVLANAERQQNRPAACVRSHFIRDG
jgi:hypothetical protein